MDSRLVKHFADAAVNINDAAQYCMQNHLYGALDKCHKIQGMIQELLKEEVNDMLVSEKESE